MNQPQTTSSHPTSGDPLPDGWREIDGQCQVHGPCKFREAPNPVIEGAVIRIKHCPACTAEAAERRETEQRRAEQRAREDRLRALLGAAQIPPRFQTRTLDTYRADCQGQIRALTVSRRLVENWPASLAAGTSLVFTGGPGTGKTHLACAIASAVIAEHYATAVFMTSTEALRSIKATYNRESERSERQAIQSLLEPDLLILDEIGVQSGSEHEKMLLFEILNNRYQHCRPTILLSNLNAADLESFLGQRVMDRYRECGVVLAFDWESQRGKPQ